MNSGRIWADSQARVIGFGLSPRSNGPSQTGPLAFIAICTEFFGGLALVLGLFTRVAALGIVIVMLVAIVKAHAPHGLFMNWFGQKMGEGFEYHLLAIALALVLLVQGAGPFSVDRVLYQHFAGESAASIGGLAAAMFRESQMRGWRA